MKRFFLSICIGCLCSCAAWAQDWNTDIEIAKSKAASLQQRIVLVFQGSDWCGNCKRLERDLFENADFQKFAEGNLVMLKVDFPMKKQNKLSKEQTEHNDNLAEQFNPDGAFPKVLIFNGNGEKMGEMAYPSKTPKEYIASIQTLMN